MRIACPLSLIFACLTLPCLAQDASSPQGSGKTKTKEAKDQNPALTLAEIIQLSQVGISEDIIIAKVRQNGMPFVLSADQIVQLKKALVSDNVVKVLLDPKTDLRPVAPPLPSSSASATETVSVAPKPREKSNENDADNGDEDNEGRKEQDRFVVRTGSRLPLRLVNNLSTKKSRVGDLVYFETTVPLATGGRMVIPKGSNVIATLTHVQRPGRVAGTGELSLRFESLVLPNGTTRRLSATVVTPDATREESVDEEGGIKGQSTKGQDAARVGTLAGTGAVMGGVAAGARGAGIGGGIGAGIGLLATLLTRGPEIVYYQGTLLEIRVEADLAFSRDELKFYQ